MPPLHAYRRWAGMTWHGGAEHHEATQAVIIGAQSIPSVNIIQA